jgi:hypothetical protein
MQLVIHSQRIRRERHKRPSRLKLTGAVTSAPRAVHELAGALENQDLLRATVCYGNALVFEERNRVHSEEVVLGPINRAKLDGWFVLEY